MVQDSFKNLKNLKFLDVSETNIVDLDACIFIQLTGLEIFQVKRVSLKCKSCWLSIAREKRFQIFGQCYDENMNRQINSLTDKQIEHGCLQSSINCSFDYCEPGSINQINSSENQSSLMKYAPIRKKDTIEIILVIVFSMIILTTLVTCVVVIFRWKQNKQFLCCHFRQTTSTAATTMKKETRRHRQQIIDKNPTVIESVVTHGANMNVPSYPYRNDAYFNDETANNKRKLYNPMFADSPTSDSRHHQQTIMVSSDSTSHNSELYSENL